MVEEGLTGAFQHVKGRMRIQRNSGSKCRFLSVRITVQQLSEWFIMESPLLLNLELNFGDFSKDSNQELVRKIVICVSVTQSNFGVSLHITA